VFWIRNLVLDKSNTKFINITTTLYAVQSQLIMISYVLLFAFILNSDFFVFVREATAGSDAIENSGGIQSNPGVRPNTNSTISGGIQISSSNYSNTTATENEGPGTNLNLTNNAIGVDVWTNRPNYVIGQEVQIFVLITSEQNLDKALLSFEITNDRWTYNTSSVVPINSQVSSSGLNTQSEGIYEINVTAFVDGRQESAQTSIRVDSMFNTLPAFFIYLTIGFFAGLAVVILRGNNQFRSELLRFICITGIVFSILFALLLTDLQIGSFSPVGLVERAIHNQNANSSREWVLNIGGVQEDNFVEGIQIPIYVIIFGLVGGYLRYLYKTAKLKSRYRALREMYLFCWENVPGEDSKRLKDFLADKFDVGWFAPEDEFKKEDNNTIKIESSSHSVSIALEGETAKMTIDNDKIIYRFIVKKENSHINLYQTVSWRSWLFYQSLEDLSLLFLAPLLAIALWFLLIEASMTSKFALALASFTVGLVTDEIIRSLLNFIRPKLKGEKDGASDKNGQTSTIEPTAAGIREE
jgi:hypothetical protein